MNESAAPRVSVLLPVRNAAATIGRAIASIRTQTWREWELIAVDDGSTDDTPGLLAALAREEPRLRVLTLPARGIVAALEAGLAVARGEFIARLDADDEALPERLAEQAAFLTAPENRAIGLVGCLVEFGGDARVGIACGTDEGVCVTGTTICQSGIVVCDGAVGGSVEVCDGLDNDCDGDLHEPVTWSGSAAETRIDGYALGGELGRAVAGSPDYGCLFASAPYVDSGRGAVYGAPYGSGVSVVEESWAVVGTGAGSNLSPNLSLSWDGRLAVAEVLERNAEGTASMAR